MKDISSLRRRKIRGRKERSEAQCFCHSILTKLLLSLLFSKSGKIAKIPKTDMTTK